MIRRHISLFNGIGGFQVAAMWRGWDNVASVEIDPFCNKVTKYHFPNCIQYDDIRKTDLTGYRGTVDVLSGGFPCQPFSIAGSQSGKEHNSYLWPETCRAIEECQPTACVLENVFGLTGILEPAGMSDLEREAVQFLRSGTVPVLHTPSQRDRIQATIEVVQSRILGQIVKDLKAIGYVLPEYSDGTPIIYCVPACAVNAPHRRDRVWIIAYREDNGCSGQSWRGEDGREWGMLPGGLGERGEPERCGDGRTAAYTSGKGSGCKSGSANNEGRGASEDRRTSIRQGDGQACTGRSNTTGTDVRNADSGAGNGHGKKQEVFELNESTNGIGDSEGDVTNGTNTRFEGVCERTEPANIGGVSEKKSINSDTGRNEHITHAQCAGLAKPEKKGQQQRLPDAERENTQTTTDTDGERLRRQSDGAGDSGHLGKTSKTPDWTDFPTQSPVCSGDDGISGRLDGITFSKWRGESIKGYGNAIVPVVAHEFFRCLDETVFKGK